MSALASELARELSLLRQAGLNRQLRRIDSPQSNRISLDGRTLLNFSSNDYLGLANHPLLKAAAARAVERYGAGSGASRLICGSLAPHHELEAALAAFKGTEAALSFSTGYATALGTICALLGKEDVVVIDRLVHASVVDAARLSGAKLRVFAHNDLEDLEKILRWARALPSNSATPTRARRILIVTESMFSMDGDPAPLRELVELKEKHGAWLMVDEAHATGLYGSLGRGLADLAGVSDRVDVQMGTLGKALGASGGYICGVHDLIELLVNRARSFIFSTAPAPAAALAAAAAVTLVQSPEGSQRRKALWQRVAELHSGLNHWAEQAPEFGHQADAEHSGRVAPRPGSAILPLIIGGEAQAVKLAEELLMRDVFVPAIRYPTVARGRARLRITMTAEHRGEDVTQFLTVLDQSWKSVAASCTP
jgi:8-amino-7-oxononanoate synthase